MKYKIGDLVVDKKLNNVGIILKLMGSNAKLYVLRTSEHDEIVRKEMWLELL
tara:strand:+ start:235 stop:390 length:156 start_codon:yes stop_codon:yes gene_type:complete